MGSVGDSCVNALDDSTIVASISTRCTIENRAYDLETASNGRRRDAVAPWIRDGIFKRAVVDWLSSSAPM